MWGIYFAKWFYDYIMKKKRKIRCYDKQALKNSKFWFDEEDNDTELIYYEK